MIANHCFLLVARRLQSLSCVLNVVLEDLSLYLTGISLLCRSQMEYSFFLHLIAITASFSSPHHPFLNLPLSLFFLVSFVISIHSPPSHRLTFPLWPSLYCPPLCFPFYLTNPGFSSLLLALAPFLVISYPFVWTDPYLLSPSNALVSFLLFLHLMTLIFSFSLCVSYFLPHYLCLFIYSSIYRHLSTFSTAIWHLTTWIF